MSLSPGVRSFSLFLLIFGGLVPQALAGFGVCQPGWEWANNTKNQNPCEIAGALDAQCGGYSTYVIGPLSPGSNYFRPQRNDSLSQNCNCNTVMYGLYMACTACQNASIQTWSFWQLFCDQVYVTQYPDVIPPNTAVPNWAYLNYTAEGSFDPVTAKAAGGLPEKLSPVPSTASLSITPSLGPTSVPMGPGENGTKKSSNVGAIVGGVIGGLAALAVIGVGTCLFLRKRAMVRVDEGYSDYTKVYTSAPPSENEDKIPSSHPRLYDPSDPSTYPGHVDYVPSGPYTAASHTAHYTGVPEL